MTILLSLTFVRRQLTWVDYPNIYRSLGILDLGRAARDTIRTHSKDGRRLREADAATLGGTILASKGNVDTRRRIIIIQNTVARAVAGGRHGSAISHANTAVINGVNRTIGTHTLGAKLIFIFVIITGAGAANPDPEVATTIGTLRKITIVATQIGEKVARRATVASTTTRAVATETSATTGIASGSQQREKRKGELHGC